jgi:hypothetical protein
MMTVRGEIKLIDFGLVADVKKVFICLVMIRLLMHMSVLLVLIARSLFALFEMISAPVLVALKGVCAGDIDDAWDIGHHLLDSTRDDKVSLLCVVFQF